MNTWHMVLAHTDGPAVARWPGDGPAMGFLRKIGSLERSSKERGEASKKLEMKETVPRACSHDDFGDSPQLHKPQRP